MNLAEQFKIVDGSAGPVTTNGGITGAYVSLKNALRAWAVVSLTQAVGHATLLSPRQASAVAGTAVKVLANACRIWSNTDTAAGDALVRQTDAVNFAVAADVKKKQVVFEIDPSILDVDGGFDCVHILVADSSQATNFASIVWYLQSRYPQATPPTAVAD